jgi:hypothetical protein
MILKYLAVRLLGAAVSSALGGKLLTQYASRTPHKHLHDIDGSLYMGRWRVVDEGTVGGKLLEFFTGYRSARLHHIMRPDHDRDLHSHPFSYRTFVVAGYYEESYQTGLYGTPFYRRIGEGESGTGSSTKFHCIRKVSGGGVLTLFFMTRNKGTWGFNVGGKFVESTRYLLRKGYRREQVQEVQTP